MTGVCIKAVQSSSFTTRDLTNLSDNLTKTDFEDGSGLIWLKIVSFDELWY